MQEKNCFQTVVESVNIAEAFQYSAVKSRYFYGWIGNWKENVAHRHSTMEINTFMNVNTFLYTVYNHLLSLTFCSKTFLSLWITYYSETRGILFQTIPDIITASLWPCMWQRILWQVLNFSLMFIAPL